MSWTVQQIAKLVDGELEGPADLSIAGMQTVTEAQGDQLTFIGDDKYARSWTTSRACVALVRRGLPLTPGDRRALIWVDDVDLAVARVLEAISPPIASTVTGIHPSAVIDTTAKVAESAAVGPHCYIGPRVNIGPDVVVHASVTLLDEVAVGRGSVLWPGVVVRERCRIGERCILHPNVTVGSDGFGYRPAPGGQGLVKIPQIGHVEIGHDVEIGSGTCIDRGKFAATVIGDGCKIDNLCQIAHNCRLGRFVVIAGLTGLAGSVTVGDGVMIGGGCVIRDHVTIGAGAQIYGASSVMNDVPAGATWGGYPAQDARIALREHAAMRKLPDLIKHLKKQ